MKEMRLNTAPCTALLSALNAAPIGNPVELLDFSIIVGLPGGSQALLVSRKPGLYILSLYFFGVFVATVRLVQSATSLTLELS